MFCISCGAPNPENARFCHRCGAALHTPVSHVSPGEPQQAAPVPSHVAGVDQTSECPKSPSGTSCPPLQPDPPQVAPVLSEPAPASPGATEPPPPSGGEAACNSFATWPTVPARSSERPALSEGERSYFVRTKDGTSGPHTIPALRDLVDSGVLSSEAACRVVGTTEWLTVAGVLAQQKDGMAEPKDQRNAPSGEDRAIVFWLVIVGVFLIELMVSLSRIKQWSVVRADPTIMVSLVSTALGGALGVLVIVGAPILLIARLRRRSFAAHDGFAAGLAAVFYLMALGARSAQREERSSTAAPSPRAAVARPAGIKNVQSLAGCDFTVTFFGPTEPLPLETAEPGLVAYETDRNVRPYCRAECIPKAKGFSQDVLPAFVKNFAREAGMKDPELSFTQTKLGFRASYRAVFKEASPIESQTTGYFLVGHSSILHLIVSEPLNTSPSSTALAFLASPEVVR